MKKRGVVDFSNDSFYYQNKFLYYQNKNTQTIIDILNSKFKVFLISKDNQKKITGKRKIENLTISNISSLIKNIKSDQNFKFFFVSITPFNFFFYLLLKLFFVPQKKIYVFLISDGFKEYQVKFNILFYV